MGGVSPYSFAWNNGDSSSGISNLSAGIYSVTVTDSTNCSSTISVEVSTSGTGNVIITADTTSFCAGSGVQVCAPAGFSSYVWNTGQTSTCIYAQQAGDYYVTVSDGGNCSAESNHILLNVLSAPSVSISVNGDTLRCYSGIAYQWYLNGAALNGDTQYSYIAAVPGDYSVVITDSNGCSTESNGVQILSTGISAIITKDNISIYPNPFSQGNVTLEVTPALLGSKAEIYDSKGSMVNGFIIETLKMNLDMPFESGVYIVRITSGSNIYIRKLVKL
jgi:hypothetical protein